MDGNGRWATQRGLPRTDGHRAGATAVRTVVTRARETGVEYLTLYAFSSQNWKRPMAEVAQLMTLLVEFCQNERKLLLDKGIRFRVIGQRDRIPLAARKAVDALERVTRSNTSMQLVVALSYGGREEIVNATQKLAAQVAAGTLRVDQIDEQAVQGQLWTSDIPDPDLIIRTSGELRVSNFLLWQLAYSELHIDQRLWPDFDAAAFDEALAAYAQRERRFGDTSAPGSSATAPRR